MDYKNFMIEDPQVKYSNIVRWILTLLSSSLLIYSSVNKKPKLIFPIIHIVLMRNIMPIFDLKKRGERVPK